MSLRLRTLLSSQRIAATFTVSTAFLNVASIFSGFVILRWVEPSLLGIWHTLAVAASYLTLIQIGIPNALTRELAFLLGKGEVDDAHRCAQTAMSWAALNSLIGVVGFVGALGILWHRGIEWRVGIAATAIVSATTFYQIYLQATYRSNQHFIRLAQIQFVRGTLKLVLPVLVYLWGYRGLCGAAVVEFVVTTVLLHWFRPLALRPILDLAVFRRLLTTGTHMFVAGYLHVLATGFDRVILLWVSNTEAVGYYGPAAAVAEGMAVIPLALASYAYPRMSYAYGETGERRRLWRFVVVVSLASSLAGVPVGVCAWTVFPWLFIRFLPKYVPSLTAVKFAIVAGYARGLGNTAGASLLRTLKAWRLLHLTILVFVASRFIFPLAYALGSADPVSDVALGNVWAEGLTSVVMLMACYRATRRESGIFGG